MNAPLRMHRLHGTFQLDMTKAHGSALPAYQTVENGVTKQGSSDRDYERGSSAHLGLRQAGSSPRRARQSGRPQSHHDRSTNSGFA